MCGKCNKVNYCSKEHQVDHWTFGQHKIHCNTISTSTSAASLQTIEEHNNHCRKLILFPEFEVVSEQERNQDEEDKRRDDDDYNSLNEANSRALVPVGDEIYENTKVDVDKAFLKFQKRIELYPEQILRYNRLEYKSEKNPEPLWVSDTDKPTAQDINPCPYCGQERTLEFQVILIKRIFFCFKC